MSAATAPAAGDIIRIPAYTAECEKDSRRITWRQTMMEKNELYYTVRGTNVSKNNCDVILFVQGNWYNSGASPAEHVSKIGKAVGKNTPYSRVMIIRSYRSDSLNLRRNRWFLRD